jgi:hypothetical protein
MQFRLLLIALGIVLLAPVNAGTESLTNALDHMIAAYGGEANLRKLDSMAQEWDLLALTRNQQGTDKRSIHLPAQLKVELTYPDKLETRILDSMIASRPQPVTCREARCNCSSCASIHRSRCGTGLTP